MPGDHYSGSRYAVPFFRGRDLWQGFWMYTHNLKTADRLDWENTEDLLKEYFEKEDFVLERVPTIVSFLAKVGDKRLRTRLGPKHFPTKDFCERFAAFLESRSLSAAVHYKIAYEYIANTKIKHEWIGYIFSYKGEHKKTVIKALNDALLDYYIKDPFAKYPVPKEGANYKRLFVPLYKRYDEPEILPIPLYKALLTVKKCHYVKKWVTFVRNNLDSGRNEEEKSKTNRFLIVNAMRVVKSRYQYDVETRNEALNSLLITKDSNEKEFQARILWKLLRNCRYRGQYIFFRKYFNNELFKKKYKRLIVKKDSHFRFFIRAYEGDDSVFPRLTFTERLMAYNHLKEERKKIVLEEAKRRFSKLLEWKEHDDELYYALIVISFGDSEFLKRNIFDKRLEEMSFMSNKLRTFYLVKLHEIGYRNVFRRHIHFFFMKIITTRLDIIDKYLERFKKGSLNL